MTHTAQVLVVLMVVLSLLFAGMSGVLYSKRMDYKVQLQEVKDSLLTKNKGLQGAKKAVEDELAKVRNAFSVLKFKADKSEMELNKAKDLNDRMMGETRDLKQRIIQVTADKNAMQTLLKTAEDRRDLVEKELATRRAHLNEARENLNKARMEISNLNRKLAQTEDERNKLAMERKVLLERVDTLESKIALLRERYHYDTAIQAVVDAKTPVLQDIRGRVVLVDPEAGHVFINKGKADGVLKDYVFTVYRNDQFVARIRIFQVDPQGNLSAGKVINQTRPVKRGDAVATRLIP